MRSVILILILAFCALGLGSSASAEETAPDLVNGTLQNLSTAGSHFQAGVRQINGDVNLSNDTTELVNSTLQNLSTAGSHFQAGVRQINGDVNLSNATTKLANARTTVEKFIGAFNDLIQIVNRILGLVGNIQPAPGNPTGS